MTSGALDSDRVSTPENVLLVYDDGPLRIFTLNRPHVRNAINSDLARHINAAMDAFELDHGAKVGVIHGAGSSFCAGMDLKAFAVGQRTEPPSRGFAGIVERPPTKPLIAAVEGFAYAGGFEIALACDVIVAGRSASFALPEVRRGLIAAGGGLVRLASRVPFNRAMELALTGGVWSAPTAMSLGLLSQVVDDGAALDIACQLAATIAENAPLATVATKQVLSQSSALTLEQAFDAQRSVARAVSNSADALEGARAFAEKRPAVWAGR